jgi:hypothetical protein
MTGCTRMMEAMLAEVGLGMSLIDGLARRG